jgi:NAD(P)H-nitrite reductase large subunit
LITETAYLIVGSSVAAVSAATAIRSHDREGDLTVLTAEGEEIYSRPMLAHLIAGELSEDEILFRPPGFFQDLKAHVVAGERAVSIDPDSMIVTTDSGLEIQAAKILIATGSRPRKLAIEGIDAKGVCNFNSIEDARRINVLLDQIERAVIIGAGLIGMRAAYALESVGIDVTLIEMMDKVMPSIMDSEGSSILVEAMRDKGTDVILGGTVDSIRVESGRLVGVKTDAGDEIPCELVLVAAGVEPNVELVRESGIEINRGIVVDQYLETSSPGIYAAGDVVEFADVVTGRFAVNANWPNASIQGRVAGLNMAGRPLPYDGSIGMNSIECGGVPTITMGMVDPPSGEYEVRSHIAPENKRYRKLVFRGGRLVGAILIGRIEEAGILLRLINERIDVTGIEDEILYERKALFNLIRDISREDLEGTIDWPASFGMEERYEKKFDQKKWDRRVRGKPL